MRKPSDAFLEELQKVLHHLYDPAVLQESPLIQMLVPEAEEDPPSALRHCLVSAIEALQPEEEVPFHANAWRYYQILLQRYVEQYTQREVAIDIGLSIRQLRRQQKAAFHLLATYLWHHYDLEHRESSHLFVGEVEESNATPTRAEELAWSQQSFSSESIDVKAMVHTVIQTATPVLAALGVQEELVIPEDLPRLSAPRVTMQQALLSALTALVDAAPGGQLSIMARACGDTVALRMSVCGVGGNAFDEETEGLQIARALVESLGGSIQLDLSTAQSVNFTLSLPSHKAIMVVAIDDNPDTLRLLASYAVGTRYHLISVNDPQRAVETASEAQPDLILLDVMLPGIDGWELLGRLREHPRLQGVPIVVCSILLQKQLALALGATDFIRKPLSRQTFLAVLDRQIDRLR